MEYIVLTLQIAIGVIFLRLIVRKSVLPAYIAEWRSVVRRKLGKE